MPVHAAERPRATALGHAFGLALAGDVPLAGLGGAGDGGLSRVTLTFDAAAADPVPGERVSERLAPDGALQVGIDACPGIGYRVFAPGAGHFTVSADGRLVRCAPAARPAYDWKRMLVSQVLPLAALLNGREVLHAGAVAAGGSTIALTGASGAGKTSIALAVVRRGGRLVADDALAIDVSGAGLACHPGPGTVNLRRAEAQRLGLRELRAHGRVLGSDPWSVRLAVERETAALPLGTLCVLRRGAPGRRIQVRDLSAPSPGLLLATTFNLFLRDAGRLSRHLECCARMASAVRVIEAGIPDACSPDDVAAALLAAVHGKRAA